MALFNPVLEQAVAEEQNLRDNRMVRVTLLDSCTRASIPLTWNVGGPKGRDLPMTLKRGASVTLPVGRAQAFFGHFTIPHDLEEVKDERERAAAVKTFFDMKSYVLLQWGGYPQPRKIADGFEPIGPHRFPDVEVTVIEQDGSEWPAIRLHELYEIGAYDVLTFERKPTIEETLNAKNATDLKIAELQGQIATLLAMNTRPAAVKREA